MKKVGSFAAESQGFYRFLWEIVTLQEWSKSESFLSQENHFKKQLALFNRWTILWPKSIKIVHLVFYESFNRWQNKYSDRFLLEKRREAMDHWCCLIYLRFSIASWQQNGDIVTFKKHIYGFLQFFLKCLYPKSCTNLPQNHVIDHCCLKRWPWKHSVHHLVD